MLATNKVDLGVIMLSSEELYRMADEQRRREDADQRSCEFAFEVIWWLIKLPFRITWAMYRLVRWLIVQRRLKQERELQAKKSMMFAQLGELNEGLSRNFDNFIDAWESAAETEHEKRIIRIHRRRREYEKRKREARMQRIREGDNETLLETRDELDQEGPGDGAQLR
jgi:hypothetical protein